MLHRKDFIGSQMTLPTRNRNITSHLLFNGFGLFRVPLVKSQSTSLDLSASDGALVIFFSCPHLVEYF